MKKRIQSETKETVDWEHKPINALGGLRAMAVTTGGTTIDGLLEYHVEGTVDGVYVESLNFRNLPQYVIVSVRAVPTCCRRRCSSPSPSSLPEENSAILG